MSGAMAHAADNKACGFDDKTLSFSGSPTEQTLCLLRPVSIRGHVGPALTALPAPLNCVGKPSPVTKQRLRAFLAERHIDEARLGGNLDEPLSRSHAGKQGAVPAAYFVIHDTSAPLIRDDDFPADINDAKWKFNDLDEWMRRAGGKTHVFINRVGESITAADFSTPRRATQFELSYPTDALKGRFLHVELVQPRRSDPAGKAGNDQVSPTPGFSDAQYERLALVYLAASVRGGACLLPAYHAVLDLEKGDHDDPQSFSLDRFAAAIATLQAAIEDTER
jgi:hypothetical protein